jgi:hypothetical protein
MNTEIEVIMYRAEQGVSYTQDAHVLWQALKSAAQSHTKPQDILKFLKFHLQKGLEHIEHNRSLQAAKEDEEY